MNTAYENAVGDAGAALITHIALFDDQGNELSGGSYARQSVSWTDASAGNAGSDDDGEVRPSADLTFDVPAGATVGEWRGFSAATGGTDYGGQTLTNESFANAGQYTLLAAQTSIQHNAQ